MRRALPLFVAITVAVAPTSASIPPPIDYQSYLHPVFSIDTPGSAVRVVHHQGVLYVADGAGGLTVLSIEGSELAFVRQVVTSMYVSHLAVSGDYLYLTGGRTLTTLHIGDPSDPRVASSMRLGDLPRAIEAEGAHLYLGTTNGVLVFDLAFPASPGLVAHLLPDRWVKSLDVDGSHAFVCITHFPEYDPIYDEVRIVDVSTPTSPVVRGLYGPRDPVWTVRAADDFLYVTTWGLDIVDCSDPDEPALLSRLDGPMPPGRGIEVHGDRVFETGASNLRTIDVSDPANPILLGEVYDGDTYGLTVVNGYAYLASSGDGIQVIDVANPASPPRVTVLPGARKPHTASIGTFVYIVAEGGVRVTDVSNPDAPVDTDLLPVAASDVAIESSILYVASEDEHVIVFDLANPATPVTIGAASTRVERVAPSGDRLFISSANSLGVVDISDPAAPIAGSGRLYADERVRGLAAVSPIAIAAAGSSVLVVDGTDPDIPIVIAELAFDDRLEGLAFDGEFAYVAGGWDGVHVVDVSDPQAPTWVTTVETPDDAIDVAIRDGVGYVADEDAGLLVLDLTDRAHPRIVGTAHSRHEFYVTRGVDVGDHYVMLAHAFGDVVLYPLHRDGAVHTLPNTETSGVTGQFVLRPTPNPLTSSTRLSFDLARPERLRFSVFDASGRLVSVIADRWFDRGRHDVPWRAVDGRGRRLASGVYYIASRVNGSEFAVRATVVR